MRIENAPKGKKFKIEGQTGEYVIGVVGSGSLVSVIEIRDNEIYYPKDNENIPMFSKDTKITFT